MNKIKQSTLKRFLAEAPAHIDSISFTSCAGKGIEEVHIGYTDGTFEDLEVDKVEEISSESK